MAMIPHAGAPKMAKPVRAIPICRFLWDRACVQGRCLR